MSPHKGLLPLCLLLPGLLLAASIAASEPDAPAATPPEESAATVESTPGQGAEPTPPQGTDGSSGEQPDDALSPARLQTREFRPSEQISVDNSVPYPVDI